MIKDKAIEYFKNGYACSEAVIKACIDEGLCDKSLLPCATTLCGGMSSGCACGAVTASQIVLGYHFGRDNKFGNEVSAREKAAHLVSEFKKRNKVTCCKVLNAGLEGMAKKEHCSKFVADACDILESMMKVAV